MASFRIVRPDLTEHINAVGHLCTEWSHMESSVDKLLATLIPLQYGYGGHVFECISTNADFRSKLQMIKGIALARNVAWYGDLTKLLDYVDNTLRPARNRYVHDAWVSNPSGKPQKMEEAMKIKRPQAHEQPVLKTRHFTEVGLEDLWDVIRRVTLATGWLSQAASAHEGGYPPQPLYPQQFDELSPDP